MAQKIQATLDVESDYVVLRVVAILDPTLSEQFVPVVQHLPEASFKRDLTATDATWPELN